MDTIAAIRGATTITTDTREEIEKKTVELMREIFARNDLRATDKHCVSILISTTQDIHAFYPARAVRESGLTDAPLFSCAEPVIDGALPLCIRIMVTVACAHAFAPEHVYLHGAASLRPDLVQK